MNRKNILGVVLVLIVLALGVIGWIVGSKKSTDKSQPQPILSVSGFNQTKNSDASVKPAAAQDVVALTLQAQNPNDKVIVGYVIQADISDLANQATLVDAGGASYNSATNSLVWTPLDIPANQTISKKILVRVNALAANTTSAVMKIKFNNELQITIGRPQVSGVVTPTPQPGKSFQAPKTGPDGTLVILLSLLTVGIALGYRMRWIFRKST